jgi:hypothetical protein
MSTQTDQYNIVPKPKAGMLDSANFKVIAFTDGTTTQVEILVREDGWAPWSQAGMGEAKRRKPEARNVGVGFNLAWARALQDAATKAAEACVKKGYPAFPKAAVQPAQWLDNRALDVALRHYIAVLDYDLHKSLESDETDGSDRYPEEVRDFARYYRQAVKGELKRDGDDG